MTIRTGLLLGFVMGMGSIASGQGFLSDPPLEFLVGRSELVVVAKVVKVEDAGELKIAAPDERKPAQGRFTRYTLAVSEVIREEKAAAPRDPNAAPSPATQPAPRRISILAKTPPVAIRGQMPDGGYWVDLREDQSYILLLRRLPDRQEYYLPLHPMNSRPAAKQEVDKVKKAAEFSSWPWGKSVDGLQIALLMNRTQARLQKSWVRVPGGPAQGVPQTTARFEMVLALHNLSDKAIRVDLHPTGEFLKLQAADANGKALSLDLYAEVRKTAVGSAIEPYSREIAPGRVLFVVAEGEAKEATVLQPQMTPGKWTFKASYANALKGPTTPPFWNGQAESAPVEVEVKE
jgi:hypothetical protein